MSDPRPTLNPAALPPADGAALLTRAATPQGQPVTVEQIDADHRAGAPRNADGTINIVLYAAWLAKELHRAD